MSWVFTNETGGKGKEDESHVNFTHRCVDVSDSEQRLVSKVVVREYRKMTIEIPVKIIASKEQLDELIVVSMAVTDCYRDWVLDGRV